MPLYGSTDAAAALAAGGTASAELHVLRPHHDEEILHAQHHSSISNVNGANGGAFVLPRSAEADAAAAGVRQGLVAAGAEAAATVLAAEQRQAVWGEGGWPYGDAVRSADVVEGIKEAIVQQREEEARGGGALLP